MKKIFLIFSAFTILLLSSCRSDSTTTTTTTTVDIATQNSYDDQAILQFLLDHYLDSKGNIKAYSDVASTNPSLATMNPVKLASGVVYIVRSGAQPTAGTTIAANDAISLMQNTYTFVATKNSSTGLISFTSAYPFENTISGTGVPSYDPKYYYVKNSFLAKYNTDNSTTKDHSYFEIEGLKEAMVNFKAFSMANSDNYNLQGVILVPSRAAFARDASYWGTTTDRSFVFNFQIYKTTLRTVEGD